MDEINSYDSHHALDKSGMGMARRLARAAETDAEKEGRKRKRATAVRNQRAYRANEYARGGRAA